MESQNAQNNLTQYGECRCCLSKGYHRDLHREYYINGQRQVFFDDFMECFNLFLSSDQSLTTLICTSCIKRLRDASNFRTLVLENERCLLKALGADKHAEFVNVVADPLEEDTEVKEEVKSETDRAFSENEECGLEAGAGIELVPGEKELLLRFRRGSGWRLPTRDSLLGICPKYYGHLESLKGKIIKASDLEDILKPPARRNTRRKTNEIIISEKLAHAINATTILEHSNATAFKSKMRCGFPCFYCRQIFANTKLLSEHQNIHPKNQLFKLLTKYTADAVIVYADVTDLKCSICGREMTDINLLKEHLVADHDKRMYKEFSDRVIPFKLGDKEFNFDCVICDANFETFGALDRHMNTHYRHFVCEECGAGFITKHRLKIHIYLLHRKTDTVISCVDCKKTFPSQFKYKLHYESVHKKMKKMYCTQCSEKFIDYFSRQRHMEEKHGVIPILYKCTECEKSFNRKYSLTMHFNRIHLAKKDVQCELCHFMCFTKSELRDHLFKHSAVKGFVCAVCKKAFVRKKTLMAHMRVHSNEMRYSCHVCGEAFALSWRLKSHMKAHGGQYADIIA